ncbi:MAG: hypothetical protein RBJ76_18595 [Stenomitos frigidus ULC029]
MQRWFGRWLSLAELWREREMEHWEFLLQKEGDRSWLPLDSPDVEILEGRYRIVARSSQINAAIETRIVHVATEAVPPKRRVQKRSCHTNQDGLMVVIPFTRLEPGLWELQCSPKDLLTDLMAGAQPHAVTLQVVAHDTEEDWDTDWASPASNTLFTDEVVVEQTLAPIALTDTPEDQTAIVAMPEVAATGSSPPPDTAIDPLPLTADRQVPLPPEVAEMLGASMDRLFQIAEQLSEQLVDDVLQDFDLTTIASASSATNVANFEQTAEPGERVQNDEYATTPHSTAAASVINDAAPPPQPNASALQDQALPTPATQYTLAAGETFSLTLDQSAFVAARSEELIVSGQIAIVPQSASQASSSETTLLVPLIDLEASPATAVDLWDSEASLHFAGATVKSIQLCLRDPQSLQVLLNDRQPLPASVPSSFEFTFSLPDTFTTHLVLGEVLLCGSLPGQPEASIALVTQAFSITVDPNALMDELTKLHDALTIDIDDEERIDLPLELSTRLKEQASPPLDLSFLDLAVVEPPDERSPRFPSLAGQPLPPQLYRPTVEQAKARPLNLPAFKLAQPSEPTEMVIQAEETITEERESDAITATGNETNAVDVSEAALTPSDDRTDVAPEALDSTENDALPVEEAAIETPAANSNSADKTLDLPSPTHMAFQSLKLQDRFLTRLTSLASDTELSALLKANLSPGSPSLNTITAPAAAAEARSLTDEIVVDDEPLPNERHRSTSKLSQQPMQPTTDEQPNPLILPADDPVPTPALEVVTGELISGKPINIRVKLPSLLPRIYVKLWVTDRQTRSLLDGPRWLVDFLPNGLGDLEAMTPLTVPFGSVEIRLEAIAVEMHTQRESHKVTVDRLVVPPNLPSVSLDDFNE